MINIMDIVKSFNQHFKTELGQISSDFTQNGKNLIKDWSIEQN